jgi:hypothetical protein
MDSQFDLKTQTYSIPKLNMLSWGLVAAALGSAIASHYGSYPQSADMCFYPVAAQEKDNKIREQQTENSLTNVSTSSQKNLNKKLLFGSRFCNIRRGDIETIPKSYLIKAEQSSVNDQASNLAVISQGLKEGWLYQLQEFPAENPYKLVFGWATIGFSGLALWSLNFQRDQMSLMRPKYRATHRQASIQAGYSLAFAEADLEMTAKALLEKLRGLREAESQEAFLASLTQKQANRLLSVLSYEDYEKFGHLIDGGASFNKFISASVSEEAQLEDNAEYEPVVQTSTDVVQTNSSNYDDDDQVVLESKKPVENNLLFERIRNNKKGHLFIPCETGAGKTTMMLGAMRYLVKFGYKFSGSTTKLDAWGGLEKLTEDDSLPKVIRLSSDPKDCALIEQLRDRLQWLMGLLRSRQQKEEELRLKGESYNPAPYVFILDEWLETLRIAERYDRLNKTKTKDDFVDYVNTFLSTSRSAKIYIWVIAQDHQVQNASINTGLTKNLGFLVIGSHGTMVSIESALVGKSPIIQDTNIRQQLWQQAQQLAAANPKTSVSYSNVFGNEILLTPNLAGIEKEVFFFGGKSESKPESKPTDIWDETDDPKPVEQPKKVEFVNNELKEISLKQKVELLVKAGKNYKQICATLWGDKTLEEIAPILGSCCRLDKINILSECASYLLGVLRGLGWVDVTSDNFYHLIDEELADFQISEGLEELRLLEFIQVENTNVRALY